MKFVVYANNNSLFTGLQSLVWEQIWTTESRKKQRTLLQLVVFVLARFVVCVIVSQNSLDILGWNMIYKLKSYFVVWIRFGYRKSSGSRASKRRICKVWIAAPNSHRIYCRLVRYFVWNIKKKICPPFVIEYIFNLLSGPPTMARERLRKLD